MADDIMYTIELEDLEKQAAMLAYQESMPTTRNWLWPGVQEMKGIAYLDYRRNTFSFNGINNLVNEMGDEEEKLTAYKEHKGAFFKNEEQLMDYFEQHYSQDLNNFIPGLLNSILNEKNCLPSRVISLENHLNISDGECFYTTTQRIAFTDKVSLDRLEIPGELRVIYQLTEDGFKLQSIQTSSGLINKLLLDKVEDLSPEEQAFLDASRLTEVEPEAQASSKRFNKALEAGSVLGSTAVGAGIGALVGSVVPVVGTAIGAAIGAGFGAGIGVSGVGLSRVFQSKFMSGTALSAAGTTGVGAGIGAVLGTFIFPGVGTLIGAGLGAVIGLAVTALPALGAAIFRGVTTYRENKKNQDSKRVQTLGDEPRQAGEPVQGDSARLSSHAQMNNAGLGRAEGWTPEHSTQAPEVQPEERQRPKVQPRQKLDTTDTPEEPSPRHSPRVG